MKVPFYVSVAASALCLVLSIVVFAVGASNQAVQAEVQKQQQTMQTQQEQINAGNAISQQVGPNLLRDMAISSTKNEKMKTVLSKHGYNVNYTPATPAPGSSTPAPATTPAP